MDKTQDRRKQPRVRFFWPVWFGYEENSEFYRGQIIDMNNHCISFAVNEEICPDVGHRRLVRFSYPLNTEYSFEMGTYFSWAETIRVDSISEGQRKVAMQLTCPLPQPLVPVESHERLSLTV